MNVSDALTTLETWWHDLITQLFKHPAAATVAPAVIAAAAVAQQPTAPPTRTFDWSKYAGQTDRAAFMAFVMAGFGNPQDADKAAAYAAGVVKTETVVPTDSGNAASSFGPLAAFVSPYQHGRWTFQPNVAITVPITAPAGPYHIQCSGTSGAPGGDSSVRLTVTVKDANGNVVGSGDDNTYASFTSDGGRYTLDMVALGATVEDVTLAPGLG